MPTSPPPCAGKLNTFFPVRETAAAVDAAKNICAACPRQRSCLLNNLDVPDGIWGGFGREQRTEIAETVIRLSARQTICVECGGPFTPPHPGSLVCGRSCRRARHARLKGLDRKSVSV